MQQPNKSRKAKGHTSENSTKSVKGNESKSDHSLKMYDKSQPTAEQMTIAQIIDTKSEDPTLKDKLKQVMDATQRSADEAYTALHDSDNDPNRAVNLLLEGGSKDEWSTSSKKKKVRIPSEKTKECIPPSDVPVIASRGSGTVTAPTQERSPERFPARRGRGASSALTNGPSRGRGGTRTRASGRGGSFVGGRGMRGAFRKPIETWDGSINNNNVFQPQTNHEHNCSALEEDWDSEEFTGSLANSQVFTPSATGQIHESRSVTVENNLSPQNQIDLLDLKTESSANQNRSHPLTPSRLISHFANMQIQQQLKGSSMNQNCSVVMDGSLASRELNQGISKYNYLSTIRATTRPSIQTNMVSSLQDSNTLDDMRISRIAQTRVRPKIPPPSKIPLTAVEMPPEVGSSLGLLDVQFGALEFGENSESVVNSPSTPHRSPSPPTSDDLNPPVSLSHVWCQGGSTEALLTGTDRTFSPVRGSGVGSNSMPTQLVDEVSVSKISEATTVSAFYPENQLYQSSLYTKASPQAIYNSTYCSPQQVLSTNITTYSTSSSQNIYSSSSTYGSAGYPNYQYTSYGSSHPPGVQTNSVNSYQSSVGVGTQNYGTGSNSVYGTSGLGPSSSYSTPPYPTYNSSVQHNHKSLTSTANSKEFESPAPSVTLNSISHSGSISVAPTLLSTTQTTSTTKPGNISTMGKGTAMTNLPPGVPSLVGAHQYAIVGQGTVPYIQQPPVYYEDFQLMQQQRLPPHIATGYYEMGFQPATTRAGDGMQYNMPSDGRFVRADNTSPVQVSSISQQPITNLDNLASSVYGQRRPQASTVNQSGNQGGHQQPLLNPTALPPAYAYFYGGSMIPGNFQFGGPTLYPVAAGTTSGHNNTSGGPYKGPSSYSAASSYTAGIYDGSQGTGVGVGDYKSGNSGSVGVSGVGSGGGAPGGGPKGHPSGPPPVPSQQPPSNNPPATSEISNMYTKSHSVLSKVGSYDKQGFHCATPPPFNLSSQNSGMGPAPGYPQHLFIPTMAAHHNATLMHQQIHQDGSTSVSGRTQSNPTNKVTSKPNYSSTYWTQN